MLSMGNAVFRGMPAPRPLDQFSKILPQLITSGTPHHTQVLASIGSKGVCLRMREIVALRRLFFSFLMAHALATGRPVGPIVAVDGSNDAPWWPSRLFMVSLINKLLYRPTDTLQLPTCPL